MLSEVIVKNDHLTSILLSLSNIIAILSKIISPFIWNKLGFKKSNLFVAVLTNIVYLCIILFGKFWIFLILLPFLNRSVLNINYIFIAMNKFDLFHPVIAVKISKVMDSALSLAIIYALFFNYILYDPLNIYKIYLAFFAVGMISMLQFYFYYWNFDEWANKFK